MTMHQRTNGVHESDRFWLMCPRRGTTAYCPPSTTALCISPFRGVTRYPAAIVLSTPVCLFYVVATSSAMPSLPK